MVGNSAQSYSALPERMLERLDSDRVFSHCFPYGRHLCAMWGSPSGHPIVAESEERVLPDHEAKRKG